MLLNNRTACGSLNEYSDLLWAPQPGRRRWTLVTAWYIQKEMTLLFVVGSVSTTVTCPNAATYTWTSGSLSYYSSGNFMSFNMPSGNAVAFRIEARNGSNQLLETRNVSYYNYGTFAAFPDPTTDEFKIDVLENEELEIIAFKENNTKAVTTLRYCSKESVDVSQWEKGTYILRIAFRKGRTSAVSATARKLAVIIWNMVTKSIQYTPPTTYEFLDQKRKRKVQEMKKLIHKFDITPTDLGLQLNTNNL